MKIRLSRRYTFINFGVTTLASVYVYYRTVLNGQINSEGFVLTDFSFQIIASLLTLIFLFYDHLFCCFCACCLGAGEWRVLDPENHEAILVWRNGEIIDKDEEEEGKGENENVKADNNMTLKEINLVDIEE